MDFRNYNTTSIGLKNNNVGNIKNFNSTYYFGQVGNDYKGHAIFNDMSNGVTAFSNDVLYKIFSRSPKLDTLNKLINVYAPISDGNNTKEYINFLKQKTGLNENEIIPKNKTVLVALLDSMGKYELSINNFNLIPKSDLSIGYNKTFKKYAIDAGNVSSNVSNSNTANLLLMVLFIGGFIYVVKK